MRSENGISFQKVKRSIESDINEAKYNFVSQLIIGLGLEAVTGTLLFKRIPILIQAGPGALGLLSFYRSYKNFQESRNKKMELKELFKNKK
ncbi:MAG: hypothetical protein Q8P65_00425 [bacterium]|nr:hypothetical protein [bacterium]